MELAELTKNWGIGLSGGAASGKSFVAGLLRKHGELVIDADRLARDVVLPGKEGYRLILAEFGDHFAPGGGEIDRSLLGQHIFADLQARQRLEAIVHPLIRERLIEILHEEDCWQTPRLWFYEAALLFETGLAEQFREIWVTYCSYEMQRSRLAKSRQMSELEIDRLLASQMNPSQKKARARVVINTEQTRDQVAKVVELELRRVQFELS